MATIAVEPAQASKVSRRVVVWFKGTGDLRLHDNALLKRAAEVCASTQGTSEVIPAFCFDPYFFGLSEHGSPKMAPHRARFLIESVEDLRTRLRDHVDSDLIVGVGRPEKIIAPLLVAGGNVERAALVLSEEVASEERAAIARVMRASSAHSVPVDIYREWMSTLYHIDDLPYSSVEDIPDVFTPFKDKVERSITPRPMVPSPVRGSLPLPTDRAAVEAACQGSFSRTPTLADLKIPEPVDDPRATLRFQGGETAALQRVQHYIWDKDRLRSYFDTRNGMIGPDYSTKLSPWLAHGCLSPAYISSECKRYEERRVKNKSTYWVVWELTIRDFFRFFCMKHANRVFQLGGTRGEHRPWDTSKMAAEKLRRWKEGRTGLPLVDANMRELVATGFMSNRGRQNVASFLCHDLGVDWRLGADFFESLLVDYDVYQNWGARGQDPAPVRGMRSSQTTARIPPAGNWVMAAGLTGGRINRFNIVKQSRDYDAEGEYVRLWLPELANVPTKYVHTPWEMTPEVQAECGVTLGVDYPNPLTRPQTWTGGNTRGGGRSSGARSSGGSAPGPPQRGRGGRRAPKVGRVQHNL